MSQTVQPMKSCDHALEDLNRFLDGELSLLEAERLDSHAAGRPSCKGSIARLTDLHALPEAYPLDELPPDLLGGALELFRAADLRPPASPGPRSWIPGALILFALGWIAGRAGP